MLAQRWITVAPWIRTMQGIIRKEKIKNNLPNLLIWGASAGIAATIFLEPTPLFRNDILKNVPGVGVYWEKKLEENARVD